MQEQQILKAEIVSGMKSISLDNLKLLAEFTAFLQEKSEKKSVTYSESGKSRADTDNTGNLTTYDHLKMKILEESPELKHRTPLEIQENFDRISRKAAENMPYETADEFIKAMRRENRL